MSFLETLRASLHSVVVGLVVLSTSLSFASAHADGAEFAAQTSATTADESPTGAASTATAVGATQEPTPPSPAAVSAPAAPPRTFLYRFYTLYRDDWKPSTAASTAPKKRGYPQPVTAPPYPFADWPYGGSVDIGAEWTQASPLMEAVWAGSSGDAWKRSKVQVYGWINGGFNVSTSNKGHYANAPAAYYIVPDSVQLDQAVLYIEREPDTVQTSHFDWGFRLASLYGINYRFTTAKGIFSQQLLSKVNGDGSLGKEYGYDLVMAYVDLYWGQVADGLNVRIGRYISIPDIEAQLAPNNYTYSHSLLYTVDCYTQTGILATLKLNDHWLTQAGLSPGCDVAPWDKKDAKLTLTLGVQYTWNHGNDSIYPVLNALNDGNYAYNNLNSFYLTWYHKFASHPSLHISTEAWYMWEKHVPNVNNAAASGLLERNANGAICKTAAQLTCYAPEYAALNYVEKQLSSKDYISIRNEYLDDLKGQRTGFKSRYSEHLLGWGHWVGSTVLFRPEVRYERSYDVPAYASGTKKNQFVVGGDVIFFF